MTEWFAGEWLVRHRLFRNSYFLIFPSPSSGLGQHGDTTRRPFSPPPPFSFCILSLSLSLAQRDTQRGRFNTRTGETPSLRRGVLRERDEIIIAKHLHYKVVVYRVVAGGL